MACRSVSGRTSCDDRTCAGGEKIARGENPDGNRSEVRPYPRLGEMLDEERLHLGAVAGAQPGGRGMQQQPVRAPGEIVIHAVSPDRRLARERAIRTSPASRSVSAANIPRPARVMR